jgi:carbon-monoxide dehydrogenase medium subunit
MEHKLTDRIESSDVMGTPATKSVYVAPSLTAALDALDEGGSAAAPLAGGTWIMRAPIRHEPLKSRYVAIGKIPELHAIKIDADEVDVGAAVTHAALATALATLSEFDVLTAAAGRSANPAIRTMATIGGNLATTAFASADCVPALLCLGAEVEIASRGGRERITVEQFLRMRPTLAPGRLLERLILPRRGCRTAHARLPLRQAGDYPTAIVSLAVSMNDVGHVQTARVAIGSVEPVARRWKRLEDALVGHPMNATKAAEAAAGLAEEFTGRTSADVPAWYRERVLPGLDRLAVAALWG